MKTWITIGVIAMGLIILGAGAYFFFSGNNVSPVPGTGNGQNSTSSLGKTGPSPLSNSEVLAFFASPEEIKAVQTDGQVIKIKSGGVVPVSTAQMDSLIGARFSPDGSKILAEIGTQASPSWSVFGVASSSWTPLGNFSVSSAAWSPDGASIAYIEKVNGKSNIGLAKIKLADPKKPELGLLRSTLASLNEVDSQIFWPSANEIVIKSRPSKFASGFAAKFKIKEKTWESLYNNGEGIILSWDKTGSKELKFSSGNGIELIDSNGSKKLPYLTLPEKCAFAANAVYCAVPENMGRVDLPDDYYQKSLFTSDSVYVFPDSGELKKVYENPGNIFDITQPQIAGNNFYFINRADNFLYALPIVR